MTYRFLVRFRCLRNSLYLSHANKSWLIDWSKPAAKHLSEASRTSENRQRSHTTEILPVPARPHGGFRQRNQLWLSLASRSHFTTINQYDDERFLRTQVDYIYEYRVQSRWHEHLSTSSMLTQEQGIVRPVEVLRTQPWWRNMWTKLNNNFQ